MHACSVSLFGTGFLVRDVRALLRAEHGEGNCPAEMAWRLATDRGKLETYDGSPTPMQFWGRWLAGGRREETARLHAGADRAAAARPSVRRVTDQLGRTVLT
jgi:hypothetical protein